MNGFYILELQKLFLDSLQNNIYYLNFGHD